MRYYEQVIKDLAKANVDLKAVLTKIGQLEAEKAEILAVYKELNQ